MNLRKILLPLVAGAALSACADVTPINTLALPPVSVIEARIISTNAPGFIIQDATGSIYVKATLPNGTAPAVFSGQQVKVYGNLEGGQQQRIFDAYVIQPKDGRQIIVTRPTPHIGFVVVSDF
jgi:hypothetical protein